MLLLSLTTRTQSVSAQSMPEVGDGLNAPVSQEESYAADSQADEGSEATTPAEAAPTEPAPAESAPTESAPTESAATESALVSGEVLFGTTLPLDVSLGARLVLAGYVFAEASVGRSAYGGVAGAVALSLGGEEVATLLEPAFTGAWLFRAGVGVRPFGQGGPELSLGYARMTSSATWAAADLSLPSGVGDLSADITLHMLYVELGWSIDVFGPLFIRPAVGWSQVMGADLQLSSSANLSSQAAEALVSAETTAEAIIEQYGMTPTLSLSIGARF